MENEKNVKVAQSSQFSFNQNIIRNQQPSILCYMINCNNLVYKNPVKKYSNFQNMKNISYQFNYSGNESNLTNSNYTHHPDVRIFFLSGKVKIVDKKTSLGNYFIYFKIVGIIHSDKIWIEHTFKEMIFSWCSNRLDYQHDKGNNLKLWIF